MNELITYLPSDVAKIVTEYIQTGYIIFINKDGQLCVLNFLHHISYKIKVSTEIINTYRKINKTVDHIKSKRQRNKCQYLKEINKEIPSVVIFCEKKALYIPIKLLCSGQVPTDLSKRSYRSLPKDICDTTVVREQRDLRDNKLVPSGKLCRGRETIYVNDYYILVYQFGPVYDWSIKPPNTTGKMVATLYQDHLLLILRDSIKTRIYCYKAFNTDGSEKLISTFNLPYYKHGKDDVDTSLFDIMNMWIGEYDDRLLFTCSSSDLTLIYIADLNISSICIKWNFLMKYNGTISDRVII